MRVLLDEPLPRPVLHSGPVTLRGPLERDIADRIAIGSNAEFVRLVGGDDRVLAPMTESEGEDWFRRVAAEPYYWVIEIEGRAVGTARLHHLDEPNRKAMFAIGIFDPALWGKAYGSIATRLVLTFGFETLRLHRIALRVLADNHRAIRAYEKCGFVREGVHREIEFVGGRWLSDLWMSILEDEFRAQPDRLGGVNDAAVP